MQRGVIGYMLGASRPSGTSIHPAYIPVWGVIDSATQLAGLKHIMRHLIYGPCNAGNLTGTGAASPKDL